MHARVWLSQTMYLEIFDLRANEGLTALSLAKYRKPDFVHVKIDQDFIFDFIIPYDRKF